MQTSSRILLILLLTACAGRSASPTAMAPVQSTAQTPLAGTQWKRISLKGHKPIDGTTITLVFMQDYLQGSAGCNLYGGPLGGPYRATLDGTLTLTQTANTQIGCLDPPGIQEQESAYLDALEHAATYRIVNGELEISNTAGEMLLVFEMLHQPTG